MRIKIYQINMDRDTEGVVFDPMYMLKMYHNTQEVDPEIYDKVYDGEVEAEDLEAVYRLFNICKPDGYTGRSMSVSDIVETVEDGEQHWYYCDTVGFKAVAFDPEKATNAIG